MPATISCLNTKIIIASAYWCLYLLTMKVWIKLPVYCVYFTSDKVCLPMYSFLTSISSILKVYIDTVCVYMIENCMEAYSTLSIPFIGSLNCNCSQSWMKSCKTREKQFPQLICTCCMLWSSSLDSLGNNIFLKKSLISSTEELQQKLSTWIAYLLFTNVLIQY